MSITGAVAELNREIERLTRIRDSLLQGVSAPSATGTAAVSAKKPGPKTKSATFKKVIAAKKSVPAKKRVMSAATKKKISETAKARWAAAAKKASAAK